MPEVEANGVRLFYQQSGAGPDVVLVHAVTSNQAKTSARCTRRWGWSPRA